MKIQFRKTFAGKLCILFIITICLPVLVVGIYSGVNIQNILLDSSRSMNVSNLKSIANSFNVFFEKYVSITDSILVSDTIRSLALNQEETPAERLVSDRLFAAEINKLTVNAFDLQCVYLFTEAGNAYYTYNSSNLSAVRDATKRFLDSIPANRYATLGCDGIFVRLPSGGEQYHILMMRTLFNYKDRRYLGTVALEFSASAFQKLLDYSDNFTLVTNAAGDIVYAPESAYLHDDLDALLGSLGTGSPGELFFDGQRCFVSRMTSDYGFTIVQFVNYSAVNRSVQAVQGQFIFVAMVCTLLFILISVILSKRLVRPLKTLEAAMHRAEDGDLSQRVWINTNDEFAELGSNYNHMLDQLELYINRAYVEELRRLDAEYRALQSQINPHFLYNALETINSLAQINHQTEISAMVRSLAAMFRYATVQHGDFVTLEQELAHVRSYILLQSTGYEDQIEFVEQVPEALLSLRLPKLVLQPLVENCLNHGFDSAQAHFRVLLAAEYEDGVLSVSVSDNGIGMEPEKIAQLWRELEQPLDLHAPKTSIGLDNIHHRLRLTCGESSGIAAIEAVPGGGTRIVITVCQTRSQEV